ncbi:MAG: hypothetical protein ACXVAY_17670 [Mucilaginibacter sp.]
MIITTHNKNEDPQIVSHNDDSDLHNDELGENSGEDTGLAKAAKEDQENRKKILTDKQNSPKKKVS